MMASTHTTVKMMALHTHHTNIYIHNHTNDGIYTHTPPQMTSTLHTIQMMASLHTQPYK